MTKREMIFQALQDGSALSARELAECTGLEMHEVRTTLDSMRDRGFVAPTPVTYTLTAAGKTLQEQRERKAVQQETKTRAQREVSSALINRHPLDSFFGARA